MNDIIKKISIGSWISAVALVLSLVGAIIYGVNVNGDGYFFGAFVKSVVPCAIFAIVCLAIVIAKDVIELDGVAATVLDVAAGLAKIGAVVLTLVAVFALVAARAEGLSFIYFANADVILEVQTPANLASAATTIANVIVFAIAWLASLVGAFFGGKKA